jgi:hypothetical protein
MPPHSRAVSFLCRNSTENIPTNTITAPVLKTYGYTKPSTPQQQIWDYGSLTEFYLFIFYFVRGLIFEEVLCFRALLLSSGLLSIVSLEYSYSLSMGLNLSEGCYQSRSCPCLKREAEPASPKSCFNSSL